MNILKRSIKEDVISKLFKGKVIIIYGPRQSGKTTFVKNLIKEYDNSIYFNCDEEDIRNRFTAKSAIFLKNIIGNNKLIILDEAQRIENVGMVLKILVDTYPEIQVIVTGSSSFDLENKLSEPLTGRHYDFMLLMPSFSEINDTVLNLENRLIYGSYPEVLFPKEGDTALERIKSIANDYSMKDILSFSGIRKSDTIIKLLKLLAYQMSGEISFREISQNFGMSVQTIQSYIEILEKAFIVFLVNPYGKNPRTSLKFKKKIYFYDNGLRNALINNFDSLDVRQDKGALFENYIMSEFRKKKYNEKHNYNIYFYRSYDGDEIDIITQDGSNIQGYECKFVFKTDLIIKKNEDAPVKEVKVINNYNYNQFL